MMRRLGLEFHMKRRTIIAIHTAVWCLLLFIAVKLRVVSFAPLTYESGAMVYLLVLTLLVNAGVFYATALYLLPAFLNKKRRLKWLLAMLLFFLFGAALKILITKGLFKAYGAHDLYDEEPLLIFLTFFTTSIYGVMGATYRFAVNWLVYEAQKRALIHQKTVAELAFLKSQINPHFLFNALNNLYGLAHREKAETTAQGILKLADMMRYMLYECEDAQLPLRKELEYLENYVELQRLRMPGDHVTIQFEVRGEVDHLKVPPLLMVPLVENAFKHGISAKKPSVIDIQLQAEEEGVILKVKNTIHPRQHQDPKIGGTGLENLRRRLKLIDLNEAGLQIENRDGWYEAILKLPGTAL